MFLVIVVGCYKSDNNFFRRLMVGDFLTTRRHRLVVGDFLTRRRRCSA